MPRRRSVMAAILAALLFVLIGGLDGTADAADPVIALPDKDRTQLEALLGKGVVGDALPSAPLAAADTYMPSKGKATSYKVVTQGEKAGSETHHVEDTTDPSFAPGTHYTIEQVGELFFQEDSAGGIITVAEKDLDNKVLSRFTPGDPLIVPGMQAGQSAKSSHKVEVYDLSNLKKVSHSGSLDVVYTYVGTYRVTVPAGSYDAALIKWDYSGKIGPATIKDSQVPFCGAGCRHGGDDPDPQHLGHADLQRSHQARKTPRTLNREFGRRSAVIAMSRPCSACWLPACLHPLQLAL